MERYIQTKSLSIQIGEKQHFVNSEELSPDTTLNDYLRITSHLTGTKRMCLEGGCGCCMVAVKKYDPTTNSQRWFAVNSCMVSIFSCEGWMVHTIEGIKDANNKINELSELLAKENGSQCGFCSTGMVMNMYALKSSGKLLTEQLIEDSFGGNICRCTGYRPILKAFKSLAIDDSWDIEDLKTCLPSDCGGCVAKDVCKGIKELRANRWIKVFDVIDVLITLRSLSGDKSYMLVAGNTAKGVYKPSQPSDLYVDISEVKELTSYLVNANDMEVGSNITLNNTIDIFKSAANNHKQFDYLSKVAKHITLVANPSIRNIATLAGNLMIKHDHPEFPSDIFLLLETIDAILIIIDLALNEVKITPADFLKLDMNKKVIKSIILKSYDSSYKFTSYKIMPRSENSHAILNMGLLLKMSNSTVLSARIVIGNITSHFIHAEKTEKCLKSKDLFNNDLLQQAYMTLEQELNPQIEPPEPSPEFRTKLAISLFYKFILSIAPESLLSPKNVSGKSILQRPISSGTQTFNTNSDLYPVTEPKIKLEALAQTSGKAEYIYDQLDHHNQLHGALVLANTLAGSKILSIDTSEAEKCTGFVGFFQVKDLPGLNSFYPKIHDKIMVEEVFCSGTVQYFSQPVGLLVAETYELAEKAADLVQIAYKKSVEKPFLSIKDVLNRNATDRVLQRFKMEASRKGNDVKHIIKGETSTGLQYHFHMELLCCSVIPTEDGLDVYAATQWMDGTQHAMSQALNIPANKINLFVRRLGGGFGAKISRTNLLAVAAGLAAVNLDKPVKIWLPLKKNMQAIGKRSRSLCQYEVGVNDDGLIQYMNAKFYTDYGVASNEYEDTFAKEAFPNAYNDETWTWEINNVTTDIPASGYMRAPGSLQGISAIENIMEHIAYTLNQTPLQIKEINFNKAKFPQIVELCAELKSWADFHDRKSFIDVFNKNNRWKKRGIAIVPMAWQLHILGNFNCLISIYNTDGTVAITHGGIEMGQGINTKVAQVCAYMLKIPLEMIQVKPSTSISSPNSFITGNSLTSENICYVIIEACKKILARMQPVREKLNNPTWVELVRQCYAQGVQLFDVAEMSPESPGISNYYLFGVCCAEVELDVLTGQHQVLRVDLIQDPGQSMNPLIDIGQVEGAFVQGLGLHTTENVVLSEEGEVLTNRTWNYYVPLAKDIPIDFRIQLSSKYQNNVGVLHSKAIGEPPICLGVSVPLAIRNAVASARIDSNSNIPSWYSIDGCSTVESTFSNCFNVYQNYTL